MLDSLYSLLPWLIAGLLTGKLLLKFADPTLLPGLPLLGNVIALGRLGVAFINRCRYKFGDNFTINLCGKYMTFIHDRQLIDTFFRAPDSEITFRPAVEQFTQRVFGLPSKTFFPKHAQILKDLRHLLVPGELQSLGVNLAEKVHSLKSSIMLEGQQVELFGAMKSLVFKSAVDVLFGPGMFASVPGGAEEMQARFFEFEEGFELAASPFPHMFQPGFTTARSDLLKWLRLAYQREGFNNTTAGQLLERSGLDAGLAPNMLLAVLWASQANTVPGTFWSLAMLLLPENKKYAAALLSELAQEMGNASELGAEAVSKAAIKLAMDRRSTISKCVAETVRLRVHSIDLRIAAADLDLTASNGTKIHLPKGRLMAVCPFETHHDSAMYPPDAWAFDPDREPLTFGDGAAVVPSLAGLAFGGGSYRCPGRFFAEMEVALVVQLLLWDYNLELAAVPGAGAPVSAAAEAQQAGSWLSMASQLMGERGVWGLGQFEDEHHSQPASEGHADKQAVETWRRSGDISGLLPPCNLQRLVGVKVPAAPCMVQVSPRKAR